MTNWKLAAIAAANTAVVYLFLVFAVRALGRKTLTQLHPTDLVILLMLGSAVETAMVGGSTLFRVGLVSGTVLIAMNFGMNRWMLRSKRFRHIVNGGPVLLVHDGKFETERLRRSGLTESDVKQALRTREIGDLRDVRFAILEPDGRINVVRRQSLDS
jgi:uncharacterized membrane protein YcaP (DUF421 family)